MDDSRLHSTTFRCQSDENICGKIHGHFQIQNGHGTVSAQYFLSTENLQIHFFLQSTNNFPQRKDIWQKIWEGTQTDRQQTKWHVEVGAPPKNCLYLLKAWKVFLWGFHGCLSLNHFSEPTFFSSTFRANDFESSSFLWNGHFGSWL